VTEEDEQAGGVFDLDDEAAVDLEIEPDQTIDSLFESGEDDDDDVGSDSGAQASAVHTASSSGAKAPATKASSSGAQAPATKASGSGAKAPATDSPVTKKVTNVDALRKAATSLEHCFDHREHNPFCQVCLKSRAQRKQRRRKGDMVLGEKPKKFGTRSLQITSYAKTGPGKVTNSSTRQRARS